MMENAHVGLKINFLRYNCFPVFRKKLIMQSHYILQNPVVMLQSKLKTHNFLCFLFKLFKVRDIKRMGAKV